MGVESVGRDVGRGWSCQGVKKRERRVF